MSIRGVSQRPSYLSATLWPQSLLPHLPAQPPQPALPVRPRHRLPEPRRRVDGGDFRKGHGIDDNGAFVRDHADFCRRALFEDPTI